MSILLQYDLVQELSKEEEEDFTKFASLYADANCIYTSAKTGHNVQEALYMIVDMVWVLIIDSCVGT